MAFHRALLRRVGRSSRPLRVFARIIGPGFLSGMAGNDPSAVTTYSVDGAMVGYGHLWLMLLSTPLYYAVQFACAKIGRVSQRGLSQVLRDYYGRPIAGFVTLLLVISNQALIGADLAAIGSGLELVTGLKWFWFVGPVALVLWYLTVYRDFESFKKIFLVLSLAFLSYVLTTFFAHASWHAVLLNTFFPQFHLDFANVSSAIALLGATISPYSMFWQAQVEPLQKRLGSVRQQLWAAMLDVASGTCSGNLVSFFIIICTSATVFVHHQYITSAADAARVLEPLAGPLARYLFAIGLVGSGIMALPVLVSSTSYAVAGTFGWQSGHSNHPWRDIRFYLVFTAALLAGLVMALLGIDPIGLIFWANIVAGMLAPLLVIILIVIGRNRTIMHDQRFSLAHTLALVLIALILIVPLSLLLYLYCTK
jgi:NRAMP (natural resistance-associated macrophage protein)-like metal ion transporter